MKFFERLRAERNRLGMNQTNFALIGGVKKLAQINYEAGKRTPDVSYLVSIAQQGVDIQYVVTGINSTKESSLTVDERKLIDNYKNADEMGKRIIKATAIEAAKKRSYEKAEL